jgi:hypothetical protein
VARWRVRLDVRCLKTSVVCFVLKARQHGMNGGEAMGSRFACLYERGREGERVEGISAALAPTAIWWIRPRTNSVENDWLDRYYSCCWTPYFLCFETDTRL